MTASTSLKYLPQAERLLSGTLTTGGGINASVTTFDISNPPTKLPTYLELEPDVAAQREVVRVINVVGNTVTVERGVYNAGVGKTHAQNVAYKQKITSKHWDAAVAVMESGYIIEDPAYAFARASATTFTITGSDRTSYYTAGRIVRLNGSNIVVVLSSAYSTGVTTVTIATGTIPTPITSIELAIEPVGASNLFVLTKDLSLQSPTYATDTGAADAYVASYSPAPTAYVEGMRFRFKAANANTTASTININSLGVKTIKKQHDIDLVAGDIEAGQIVEIIYDGTYFQMVSVSALTAAATTDGWNALTDTFTYGSTDQHIFTMTLPGDFTTKFYPGMRMKLTQSTGGTKFFIIHKVAYSAPNTVLTIYGGTDYTLNNEAISSVYYSTQKVPTGFNASPSKWTEELSDTSQRLQSSPVSTTVYNIGTLSIDIPIGAWDVSFYVSLRSDLSVAGTAQLRAGLSTANNSFSDSGLKCYALHGNTTGATMVAHRRKLLELASKTTYYLVGSVEGSNLSNLIFNGDQASTIVRAISAYL